MASIGSIVNGPQGPAVVVELLPGSSTPLGPYTQSEAVAQTLSGGGGFAQPNALTGATQSFQTQATILVALLQLSEGSGLTDLTGNKPTTSSSNAASAYRTAQSLFAAFFGG